MDEVQDECTKKKNRLAIHDTEANGECSSERSGAKRLCCPSPDIEG